MRRPTLLAALLTALVVASVTPAPAVADFGITPGSFTAAMLDADGNPEARAGAHPDVVRVAYSLNEDSNGADGNVKDTEFDFPPGFVGADAVPRCRRELISLGNPTPCPPESQIGTVDVRVPGGGLGAGLYSVDPGPGSLSDSGFELFLQAGHLVSFLRPDGGVTTQATNGSQDGPVVGVMLELWGIPADHQTGTSIPRRASITTPARCDAEPPAITLRVRSWQDPDDWQSATADFGPTPTGCENQQFDPALDFELDDPTRDGSTGAEITVTVPQDDDPDGQASAHVKDMDIEMPKGIALAPGGAGSLATCSEQAFGLGQAGAPQCPRSSQIGTVELDSGLLDDPIQGRLFLGAEPAQIFLSLAGPGIEFKIEGSLLIDPATGQLTTRLSNLPDLPFDRMTIKLGGLATPLSCGDLTATAKLTPYGGRPGVATTDIVAVTAGGSGTPCPATPPFAPTFVAGTSPAIAGAPARMLMTIGRRDGDQLLGGFNATLPRGVGARLGSVPRCPGALVAANACPAASRIGSADVEVGPGGDPLSLAGEVFVTGPYAGAPFGLSIVLPASVGPFDFGRVSVRAALRLDPRTGQVTIDSDPLPNSALGIPLRIQKLAIDIDRPGFLVNPTSCAPARVGAEIQSTEGATSRVASRFAVRGCRGLRFDPAVSMALTNPSSLYAGGHPGLSLRIRPGTRGANLRSIDVGLPRVLGLAVDQIRGICAVADAERHQCPRESRVGGARVRTPLLPKPLKGGLYIVQGEGGLPDLWALVGGSGAALQVRMQTIARDGRLHSKIADVPDVPLSSMALSFASGKYGVFEATSRPCDGKRPRLNVADLKLTAQNRARRSLRTLVSAGRACRIRAASAARGK